jgi:hypothetical protein
MEGEAFEGFSFFSVICMTQRNSKMQHCEEQAEFELTIQDRFIALAPNRPYCTDQKGSLVVRGKEQALKKRYVQYNPPAMCHWVVFDLDHEDPFIWLAENVAEPNYLAVTPFENTSHVGYAIRSVCTSESARRRPIEYLEAIERAYRERLQADIGFTVGCSQKNRYTAIGTSSFATTIFIRWKNWQPK